MITKKDKKTLKDTYTHLKGYCYLVEKSTGYNAVALRDCMKDLKKILRRLEKVEA